MHIYMYVIQEPRDWWKWWQQVFPEGNFHPAEGRRHVVLRPHVSSNTRTPGSRGHSQEISERLGVSYVIWWDWVMWPRDVVMWYGGSKSSDFTGL